MDLKRSSSGKWIREYCGMIRDGRVIVDKKIEAVYKHLLDKLDNPEMYAPFQFDDDKANKVIDFIESFCHQSKGSNKLLNLMLWQKAYLSAAFGFVNEDGMREYKEVGLIVARKNGKSEIDSGVANYIMFCDDEPGAELYSVATKRDQSKIIWSETVSMIRKSPALRKRSKCLVSEIKCKFNDVVFRPLSSDSNSLDGLNVHAAFIDELHAIKDKNLFDVIVDGTSARRQPLIWITSTAGMVRDGIYDIKYEEYEKIIKGYADGSYMDERVLPIIYELDSNTEINDEDMWIKANPALDVIKDRDELRRKVYKAKSDDRLLKNLLCKDFNVKTSSVESYFSFEDIENKDVYTMEQLKPNYCIGGFDLSQTTDLTCATILFKTGNNPKYYVKQMYWIPEDRLQEHIDKDKAPYDIWVERGYLRLCKGNRIDHREILHWFAEIQEKYDCYLYKIGYDAWSAAYLVSDMGNYFGQNVLVPIHQGKKTLSLPMQELKSLFQKKQINYDDNPMLKMCLLNTQADYDINGNVQPFKDRKKNIRIDGFSALLNAYTVYIDNQEDYEYMI